MENKTKVNKAYNLIKKIINFNKLKKILNNNKIKKDKSFKINFKKLNNLLIILKNSKNLKYFWIKKKKNLK